MERLRPAAHRFDDTLLAQEGYHSQLIISRSNVLLDGCDVYPLETKLERLHDFFFQVLFVVVMSNKTVFLGNFEQHLIVTRQSLFSSMLYQN